MDKIKGTFDAYGKYYDLFYKDKDYRSESDYVDGLIKRYNKDSRTILDLGSGTGQHCMFFSGKGYDVTGVEISETMVERAKENILNSDPSMKVKFMKGDIRDIDIGGKFDVIVSLFHVMSYQTLNDDFLQTLKTVRDHLKDDGKFIFDFWYGPAVLKARPESRVRKLSNDEIEVARYAEPFHRSDENVVDVNYRVIVKDRSGKEHEIREKHSMRYFFLPEIKLFLEFSGLKFIDSFEWMKLSPLTEDSWNALVVAGKK